MPKIKSRVKFSQVGGSSSFQLASLAQTVPAQQSVHPTGGDAPPKWVYTWLKAGSVKEVLSRLTHQRVTQTVRRIQENNKMQLRALYYPYARSFDQTFLKHSLLIFDELWFTDPMERGVREIYLLL